jgi:DNA invertase Pin-like site-specific DNA recombinase
MRDLIASGTGTGYCPMFLRLSQHSHAEPQQAGQRQMGTKNRIDTSTPSDKAMFRCLACLASLNAHDPGACHGWLGAGKGRRNGLGRPATIADDAAKVPTIRAARAAGKSMRTIAREQGVGVGTVSRLTG